MSESLAMVQQQVLGFQNGQISIDDMWDRIDAGLAKIRKRRAEDPDPYEDDKTDRRTTPPNQESTH